MIKKFICTCLLSLWLPAIAADTYNTETGVLSVPLVNVNDTYYANVKLTVGSILSVGTKKSPSLAYDTYDVATNQLYIPIVYVGDLTYYFVTITVGSVLSLEGSFFPSVKSQDPIAYRKTVVPNPVITDPLLTVSLPSQLAPAPTGTNLKVWISNPLNPSSGLSKGGLFISSASVSNWKYHGPSTDGSMYLTLADGAYLLDTVEPGVQAGGVSPYTRKRYTINVSGGVATIPEAKADPTGYFILTITLTNTNQASNDFLKILRQMVSVPVSSYSDSSPCHLKDQATPIRALGSLSAGFPKVPVRLSSYGRIKALVVPLDFPDLPGVDNTVIFFSPIVKTVSDFYVAQSFGKVAMDFDIVPNWVRMPFLSDAYKRTWSSAGVTSGDISGYLKAVVNATDGPIDFNQYEAVYFLVSKEMPYATMSYGPAITTAFQAPSGVIVNAAVGGADMYSNTTNGATWKWMAHETGHLFGLFDEDLEHQSQTLGFYSLMANSWSNGSIELGAWDRHIQGWLSNSQVSCITPSSLLAHSQSFELTPIERQTNELKAIMIPLSSSKILVIESRKNEGFDVISSSNEGVLVYTVDMTLGQLKGGYVIQPRVGTKNTNSYLDALLKAGDVISVGNIRIAVQKLSKTVDTVQISFQ